MAEQIVHYASPEAASIQTVTGWVDRFGRFWGNDEHMARYSGCTHRPCESCGEPIRREGWTCCNACRKKKDAERWATLPEADNDEGNMIYSAAADRYFADWDEAIEYAVGGEYTDLRALMLQPTEANHLQQIDDEYWCDVLPEDSGIDDVDGAVAKALKALNTAIAMAPPVSWSPTNERLAIPAERLEEFAIMTGATP